MVNTAKSRRDSSASPREVGEIDTRAPFQSVRAAVSLFGETVTSPRSTSTKKSKSPLEGVIDKEAEFHFAQKELGRCKSLVKNAESAANKALPELEKAMKTLLELKDKIKAVNASKDSITEETEALRVRVKELEEAKSSKQDRKGKTGDEDDLEACRKGYKAAAAELDAAKQELNILHIDFDAALEAKSFALQMAEEAQIAAKEHSDDVAKLSKEIEKMKGKLDRVNHNTDKEERALEVKLAETNKEIEGLKAQIAQAKGALSESERNAYSELNAAKEAFRRIEQENRSIQEEAEALKVELAEVGKEIAESRENEAREQSLARRLQEELQAKEGVEKRLERAVKEAEEAKAAERKAQNELKILSEGKNAGHATASGDIDQKKELSKEEYEALKEKASEPEKFAEAKLASAMAELEALRASENAAEKNLKASLREIEEVAKATEEAFKEAEMADTAKLSMQRELRRQHEQHSHS